MEKTCFFLSSVYPRYHFHLFCIQFYYSYSKLPTRWGRGISGRKGVVSAVVLTILTLDHQLCAVPGSRVRFFCVVGFFAGTSPWLIFHYPPGDIRTAPCSFWVFARGFGGGTMSRIIYFTFLFPSFGFGGFVGWGRLQLIFKKKLPLFLTHN